MKEFIYEESASCKNKSAKKIKFNIFKALQIIFLILCIAWLVIAYFNFDITVGVVPVLLAFFLPSGIFFAISFLFSRLKKSSVVDYDYAIVSTTLRFSKVINDSFRTGVYMFDIEKVAEIGNFNSQSYIKRTKTPDVVIDYLTQNRSPDFGKHFYYLYVPDLNFKKRIVVIECTATFMNNLLRLTKPTVKADGFKVL